MQADVQPGRTAALVAKLHSLDTRAVENAFHRGLLERPSDEAMIERVCLRCTKTFFTDTPFVRMCACCKSRDGVYTVGWIG